MDFIKAVNIIGRDLEEAGTLLDQLSSVPGSHLAETELAKARIRTAAELLKLLPGLAGAEATISVAPHANTAPEIESEHVAAPEIESEHVAPPEIESEHVAAPAPEPAFSQPQPKPKEATKAILADSFKAGGTIGEKISSPKQDDAINSVIKNKPIADIATAIGINDRFYYIRELFSGDATAYHDTVGRLNSAVSLGEAMKILDESTVMGSDPAAQSSFVDVVRRKFSVNV